MLKSIYPPAGTSYRQPIAKEIDKARWAGKQCLQDNFKDSKTQP
ncbi:MAG: hypothetical protein OFPI_17620 [Osedax symbiont Rs2]|nr:MAG: hypothetical protein OFPI_17620 [Osedax symbiont Rs2]